MQLETSHLHHVYNILDVLMGWLRRGSGKKPKIKPSGGGGGGAVYTLLQPVKNPHVIIVVVVFFLLIVGRDVSFFWGGGI
jgi:hypothetical protein